jgi:hypothetical protein
VAKEMVSIYLISLPFRNIEHNFVEDLAKRSLSFGKLIFKL